MANVRGWGWPLVGGDRASALALGLLGVGMYALCPAPAEPDDAVTTALGVLGVGVIFLSLGGLLIGSHLVLAMLVVMLAVIWATLTARHLRHRSGRAGPAERVPVDS